MSQYNEVEQPIICSPYEEPDQHWLIRDDAPAARQPGRRPAVWYYRPPKRSTGAGEASDMGIARELDLVNDIRERVKIWRDAGYPGIGRVTLELLNYWKRDGRQKRFFFCQMEAIETIIFLVEGRTDMKQGLNVPREDLPELTAFQDGKGGEEYRGFLRYACKMATGTGKTMLMGLTAAWSILNKINDRSDARFSEIVLVVCPNLTIKDRLAELDPNLGDASIYRIWDIVPPSMMNQMRSGKVVIVNWQKLQPKDLSQGAKVDKRGKQSDTSLVRDIMGRSIAGRQNVLVFNDEAHHAYRVFQDKPDDWEKLTKEEKDEWEDEAKQATVWVGGLDKINKIMGINLCLDVSATPYFLNRTGNEANTPFPWVISDFGLVDAIESGLVKIPQLPVADTTGAEIPAYFNVWKWILPKLTSVEKGGKKGQPKPEAILKYANMPIAQLAGLWLEELKRWRESPDNYPTAPVFIIVCRNIKLATLIHDWIAEDKCPIGIPSLGIDELRNKDGIVNTIRVDSKVIDESETSGGKEDEKRLMRFTLDTIGKTQWSNNQPPLEWAVLAEKLNIPIYPPGRDVRCVVSVAMLTEGWDCRTVTHIVGLRPFTSQLLCEQVIGRGLRRVNYEPNEQLLFDEEVSKIYGVPFEIIPYKTNPQGPVTTTPKIHHIKAISPSKDKYEIKYPIVEGYSFSIKSKITVNWDSIPRILLDPLNIPHEVDVKGLNIDNRGKLSISGPGRIDHVTLQQWRANYRLQALKFDLAKSLTEHYSKMPTCEIPNHALFMQMLNIIDRFLNKNILIPPGQDVKDVFLSPYYGWAVEILLHAIRPDTESGETPELPVYNKKNPYGSTFDVDYWTSKPVKEVVHSHVNYVVADTKKWEQSVTYYLDKFENVGAFVKNSGLGFTIPYFHNGQWHDYIPDFIVHLTENEIHLGTVIIEVKGYDPLQDIKRDAALRWVNAVNAEGSYGIWDYRLIHDPIRTRETLRYCVNMFKSLL